MVFGKEVGENGTANLQGCMELQDRKRLLTVKEDMGLHSIHLEVCRGSPGQNMEYSKKSDKEAWEIGTSSGKINDLMAVTEDLIEGVGLKAIADTNPVQNIIYNKGITQWKDMMGIGAKRDFKTEVIVLVGAFGIDKSKLANEIATKLHSNYYYKPRGEWWDGFNKVECVIMLLD